MFIDISLIYISKSSANSCQSWGNKFVMVSKFEIFWEWKLGLWLSIVAQVSQKNGEKVIRLVLFYFMTHLAPMYAQVLQYHPEMWDICVSSSTNIECGEWKQVWQYSINWDLPSYWDTLKFTTDLAHWIYVCSRFQCIPIWWEVPINQILPLSAAKPSRLQNPPLQILV